MSYKNRRMIKESFENPTIGDEIDYVEASLIQSDLSDAEVDAHFGEGEVLASDTDTVEKMEAAATDDVGSNNASILAVESIARRWDVQTPRRLSRESMVPYTGPAGQHQGSDASKGDKSDSKKGFRQIIVDLWERFLEWAEGIITSIAQGWKNLFSAGRSFEAASAKYSKRLKNLGSVKPDAKPKINGIDNIRVLSIDGDINPSTYVGSLPRDILQLQTDIADWLSGNLTIAKDYIELKIDGSEIDRMDNKHKGSFKQMTLSSGFFKETKKKLKKMGPANAKEDQFLVPVMNNDFIQVFSYETEYVNQDVTLPYGISGMRYISAMMEVTRHNQSVFDVSITGKGAPITGVTFKSVMSPSELMHINSNLGELGKGLREVERKYTKVMGDVGQLKKDAKAKLTESRNTELDIRARGQAAIANRIAREAILSTQAAYRATTSMSKSAARACNLLLKANIACYA
jgi:hypothetical protein